MKKSFKDFMSSKLDGIDKATLTADNQARLAKEVINHYVPSLQKDIVKMAGLIRQVYMVNEQIGSKLHSTEDLLQGIGLDDYSDEAIQKQVELLQNIRQNLKNLF